jgi:alpha-L-rhamnosidase
MWYVLEVEEYLTQRNKSVSPDIFRKSVEGIVSYLADYENEDGLLENLPSWNFVEWSDANTWTQNVNYPTNFLYSEMLLAAYRLYGVEEWRERAERARATARERSFDGKLFTDNAVRNESGSLVNTGNTSEACQYYALLFGGADLNAPEYAYLKNCVLHGFDEVAASDRRFVPVNAFIGLYLRIKFLLDNGYTDILLSELNGFFGGMVEKTGTLWEMREPQCSLDHGFASYVAYAIGKALQ